jgi:hypothetical protein
MLSSEVELLLRARDALSVIAPHRPPKTRLHRSLEHLAAAFARPVDAPEGGPFARREERRDVMTFRQVMEDVWIASFHVAASARLQALRALPKVT